MSYQTLEVDLENGRVRPRGTDALPAKARALLTIVEEETPPADTELERSLAERVRRFEGIGRGEFTDLSTNKQHLHDMGPPPSAPPTPTFSSIESIVAR